MKQFFFLLFVCAISFELAYGDAGIIIPHVRNVPIKADSSSIEILYDSTYHVYFPSRVINTNRTENKNIIYSLHVVMFDSDSVAKIKTIQVPIPQKFEFSSCHIDSDEYIFSFVTKSREILVAIPTHETGKRSGFENDTLFTNKVVVREFFHNTPRERKDRIGYYSGICQRKDYTLYYYNFNKIQKKKYNKVLQDQ